VIPVRIAIVDDARFIREALVRLLAGDARIDVVGTAASGEELLARLDEWQPDAVTLDLQMPGLGGLETLRELMARRPLPVVILSTHSGEGAPATMEALSLGAADFVDKEAYSLVDFKALREVLVSRLLQVCGHTPPSGPTLAVDPPETAAAPSGAVRAVAIGASTGGPRAVERVLRELGGDIAVPIVVVQHMPVGFTRAFAERLDRALPIPVAEARDGGRLEPGAAVVAPAGMHLVIEVDGPTLVTRLVTPGRADIHRPSIDVAFRSLASAVGADAIGVLLTGMGADGAQGMLELKRRGARTIAEAESTCVVYGMPRAAVLLDAVHDLLPLPEIGGCVRGLLLEQLGDADRTTPGAAAIARDS